MNTYAHEQHTQMFNATTQAHEVTPMHYSSQEQSPRF